MRNSSRERGVTLVVALIILLIVSFMGVSAMRSSILNERMAFNTQARERSFQAAETAINGVINEARSNNALLDDLVGSLADRSHCMGSTGQLADGTCGATDTFDIRQSLYGQAASRFVRQRVAFNNDAAAISDYQFETIGTGGFIASRNLPFVNFNQQEWRKLGPAGGPFEVSNPSEIGINVP